MRATELNLQALLQFMPDDGLLRLGSQRNLLFSQNAFAKLRRLMHDQLGHELARSLLTKFGFQNGAGDFRTISSLFDFADEHERLSAGPMMHSWSGIVKVEPTLMEMDRETGHFHFKGIWRNSYEAEIHLSEFGLSEHPVCYTLTGYGSGWCSEFFGMPLLEIETKCVACGDPVCEWEIKPFKAWSQDQASPWKSAMMATSKSIARQLEDQKIEVERLNISLESTIRERTAQNERLLRVLCHDLKTPLTILKHAIQNSGVQCPDSLRVAEEARRSIEEVIQHVQLTPSGFSAEGEILSLREAAFSDLIARSAALFELQFSEKDLAFQIDNKLSPDQTLLVDPAVFVNNILNNLLGNALKFSPRGGTIRCEARCDNDVAAITISDQGIGIPRDLLQKLHAGEKSRSREGLANERGQGFGLRLVRDFVEMHGGRFAIESRSITEFPQDHGTSVSIEIPMRRR